VGHETYLAPKGNGDHSMSRKRLTKGRMHEAEPQGPRAMVRARLPEVQSSVMYECHPSPTMRNDDATSSQPFSSGGYATPVTWTRGNEPWQGDEWTTYSALNVHNRRTTGSPTGQEPYGDGVSIVVVGVTPDQGGRESRPQGEGRQGVQTDRMVRCV
jgi:hypothetical protein